jgi:hypothetical protein
MNWSNGFSTTLTLRCSAIGRPRYDCVQRSPAGVWRLRSADGGWLRAELRSAWLAGPAAGLAFRGADGSRKAILVLAGGQLAAHWRRLRVQLKLPPS